MLRLCCFLPPRAAKVAQRLHCAPGWSASFSVITEKNRESLGLTLTCVASHKISHTGPVSASDQAVHKASNSENRRRTSIIKNAATKRDWPAAQEAFAEASPPDSVLYSVLLHAADRCNRAEEAFRIYDDMCRDSVPMSGTHYVSLFRLAGRAGQLGRVLTLKEEMSARGIPPCSFTCAALVDAYKRAGDADGALRTWTELKELGVSLTEPLLSALMSAVARTGDVARTEALLREADGKFKPNRIHVNCILDACKFAADADSALRILSEQQANGVKPDVITFTLLLAVLQRAGRPKGDIEAVLQQMKDCQVAPDKFFVEEHLSCIVGMDLKQTQGKALQELPPEVLAAAADVLREARTVGIELSWMAVNFEQHLSQARVVDSAAPDWIRVVSAGVSAGAAQSEYFWDRTSGRTQWERPAGHVIAGTVEAEAPAAAYRPAMNASLDC